MAYCLGFLSKLSRAPLLHTEANCDIVSDTTGQTSRQCHAKHVHDKMLILSAPSGNPCMQAIGSMTYTVRANSFTCDCFSSLEALLYSGLHDVAAAALPMKKLEYTRVCARLAHFSAVSLYYLTGVLSTTSLTGLIALWAASKLHNDNASHF